jgi:site-specific DNA recombinase
MTPIQTIAIYARVSTSNQEDQKTIQAQILALKVHAQEHNFFIVKEYTDDGWSGDSLVRPALDQLRMDAKLNLWDGVLLYDPDRLARRYSYQELVGDELKEAGKKLLYVTTPAPQNSIEKILFGVQGLFAEYERAKIADRFRLGKIRKLTEGHVMTTEAPFGYTFIPNQGRKGDLSFQHGFYQINPDEAKIIKNIFEWVAYENLTISNVVRRLRDLNIEPRKSKRKVWATSTLSTLLKNKTFIGEAHYGRSIAVVPTRAFKQEAYKRNKKSSRKIAPESTWYKVKVPAIIEEKLFYRAQEVIKMNFEKCVRHTKNQYLLSGKIYCVCGSRRAGEGPQKGKHLYYRCSDKIKRFPLPRECFEKAVLARLSDDLVALEATRNITTLKGKASSPHFKIDKIEAELKKCQAQIERYTQTFVAGIISMEKLLEYINPLKEAFKKLSEELDIAKSEMEKPAIVPFSRIEELKPFSDALYEILENLSFAQKRYIIDLLVIKVEASKKELKLTGNVPPNINEYVELFTNYRHSWESIRHLPGIDSAAIPFEFVINTTLDYCD